MGGGDAVGTALVAVAVGGLGGVGKKAPTDFDIQANLITFIKATIATAQQSNLGMLAAGDFNETPTGTSRPELDRDPVSNVKVHDHHQSVLTLW